MNFYWFIFSSFGTLAGQGVMPFRNIRSLARGADFGAKRKETQELQA
jgi:hypothetical protein